MSIALYDLSTNISLPRCYDLATARITVMGDSECGKTSLILRWLRHTFQPIEKGLFMEDIYHKSVYYQQLLERIKHESCLASEVKECSKDGTCINAADDSLVKKSSILDIQFLDSEASETTYWTELRTAQISQSDAFILCFDPTNKESFESIKSYYGHIEETLHDDTIDPVIVICSTKCDLFDREVTTEEISDTISKLGLSVKNDYFEVSAKSGTNTAELLCSTLKKIALHKERERDECRRDKAEQQLCCSKSSNNDVPTKSMSSQTSRPHHSDPESDSRTDVRNLETQPASLISSRKEDPNLSATINSKAETKTLSSFPIKPTKRSGCCIIC